MYDKQPAAAWRMLYDERQHAVATKFGGGAGTTSL